MVAPVFWNNLQVISYSTGPRPFPGGNIEKFGASTYPGIASESLEFQQPTLSREILLNADWRILSCRFSLR